MITKLKIFKENNNNLTSNNELNILLNDIQNETYFINNNFKLTIDENENITISGFDNISYMLIPTYFRNLIDELCILGNYKKTMIYQGSIKLTKNTLYEAVTSNLVYFNDEFKLSYYKRLWDSLNIYKSVHNKFFNSLYTKMITKKVLTKLQWIELEYLLKNGKSRYEAGILPKNY
jgi:hypothetical protein